MRFGRLLGFSVLVVVNNASVTNHPRGDAFCQARTGDDSSYCKFYQNPPNCHGSTIDCSTKSVEAYFTGAVETSIASAGVPETTVLPGKPRILPDGADARAASNAVAGPPAVELGGPVGSSPWQSITLAQRDSYCQRKSGNPGSYCKVRNDSNHHVCHGSNHDCSQKSVYEFFMQSQSPTTTTSTARPRGSTSSTTARASTRTSSPTTSTRPATSTSSTTTRAPPGSDPCKFSGATLLGHNPTAGDVYYMPVSTLKACLASTKITHADALWTLHNLYYGVAETYSFTDIAVDSLSARQTNTCGYRLHPVSVDLMGELNDQIAEYNAVLSPLSTEAVDAFLVQERPAYAFHANLLRMMNNLHDAHTLYATPYDMFRVYVPLNFGSAMVKGKQVVTLRYTTDQSDVVGRLARAHERVFGSLPFEDDSFNGKIVDSINGVKALDFLLALVRDNGPLAASYQQAEQRLNAHIFSNPLLVFGLTLATVPDFDSLTLVFADQKTPRTTVQLLGQFTDQSTSPYYPSVPNLRSSKALSSYLHSNPAFNAFMNHEENAKEMRCTLWKSASAVARVPDVRAKRLMSSAAGNDKWLQMSKKHKALLCPVKNYMRDHLLNVPRFVAEMVEPSERRLPFADADVLASVINSELASSSSGTFTELSGMSYAISGDTVVVRIPSMVPEPTSDSDDTFYYFPDFIRVQQAAKAARVTRLLFDVTGNGGGYVMSAYALLWYTMAEPKNACAPLRKRLTPNWELWLQSFGDGLQALVDRHLVSQGETLADKIDAIFKEISSLVSLLYDGLGLTYDQLGSVTKSAALTRVSATKASIAAKSSKKEKASAIVNYIKTRGFIPVDAPIRDQMVPTEGYTPFDAFELCKVQSDLEYFRDPMSIYREPETKNWGRPSIYSQPGLYSFCFGVLDTMPQIATGYETGYWTQVAFVSDGTCGSACALFTQALQTNGDAVAFSYGGIADTPLDVASFAGGNVEEYSSFWPSLSFAAKVGHLISGGRAPWSVRHEKTWVSSPIAFPTRASARFNWNMMFSPEMGPDALPRQFYLIPARKHFNLWTASEFGLSELYAGIVAIRDWSSIPAQFASTHGQCPKEVRPFAARPRRHVY